MDFNPVLSGIRDYSLRAEMILLKEHRVEWWRVQGDKDRSTYMTL